MPDPKTEALREEQARREREELRRAERADAEDEADQHTRRADRAAYLGEKLDARAEAERNASD